MGLVIKTSTPTATGDKLRHDGVADANTLALWDFSHRACYNPDHPLTAGNVHNLVGPAVGNALDTSTPALGAGAIEVDQLQVDNAGGAITFDPSAKGIKFSSAVSNATVNANHLRMVFDLDQFGPWFYADGTEPNQPRLALSFWMRFHQALSNTRIAGIAPDVASPNPLNLDLALWSGGEFRYVGNMTSGNTSVDWAFDPQPGQLFHVVVSPDQVYRDGTVFHTRVGEKIAYMDYAALNHVFSVGPTLYPSGDIMSLYRMSIQSLGAEPVADFVARERAYIEANKTRIPWHTDFAG